MKQLRTDYALARRSWPILIVLVILGLPLISTAKTNIYYVAGSSSKASPAQKSIIDKITSGFKTGLGDMWIGKMNYRTWNDNDSRKSLLEEQTTDYVLLLDEWRENEAKGSFEVKFKMLAVKNGHFTESIWWLNNDYRFSLYSGQPVNLEKFVDEVCTDIDLYLKSSNDPAKRKFRPRIKIEAFETGLSDVDMGDFVKWLNEELNSKYAVGNQKYIFYYSSKKSKIYPETSIYKITGSIKNSVNNGGKLMIVEMMIEFPNVDETELEVELSKDYKNDKQRGKVLVENFDHEFNDNIQYYER
jgi:hypothetical protein